MQRLVSIDRCFGQRKSGLAGGRLLQLSTHEQDVAVLRKGLRHFRLMSSGAIWIVGVRAQYGRYSRFHHPMALATLFLPLPP